MGVPSNLSESLLPARFVQRLHETHEPSVQRPRGLFGFPGGRSGIACCAIRDGIYSVSPSRLAPRNKTASSTQPPRRKMVGFAPAC